MRYFEQAKYSTWNVEITNTAKKPQMACQRPVLRKHREGMERKCKRLSSSLYNDSYDESTYYESLYLLWLSGDTYMVTASE